MPTRVPTGTSDIAVVYVHICTCFQSVGSDFARDQTHDTSNMKPLWQPTVRADTSQTWHMGTVVLGIWHSTPRSATLDMKPLSQLGLDPWGKVICYRTEPFCAFNVCCYTGGWGLSLPTDSMLSLQKNNFIALLMSFHFARTRARFGAGHVKKLVQSDGKQMYSENWHLNYSWCWHVAIRFPD